MKKILVMLALVILKPGTVSASWSVTFENINPCASNGSSVKLSCSYNYTAEETVQKTAWYKGELINGTWRRVALSDLPSYQNRYEYLGDQQHDCGLAIHNLQVNDTGHYYFRFDTETFGRRSKGSVYLTVTDFPSLKVLVGNSTEVLLAEVKADINRVILYVGIGVKVFIVLLLSLVVIWRLRRNSAVYKEESCHDYENVSTA